MIVRPSAFKEPDRRTCPAERGAGARPPGSRHIGVIRSAPGTIVSPTTANHLAPAWYRPTLPRLRPALLTPQRRTAVMLRP